MMRARIKTFIIVETKRSSDKRRLTNKDNMRVHVICRKIALHTKCYRQRIDMKKCFAIPNHPKNPHF